MPFQIGGVAIHDDGQHFGSAKRAGISGVAPLSASQKVPVANLENITNTEISAGAAIAFSKLAVHRSQGSYAGDSTANRAIAHGLGSIPRRVVLAAPNAGPLSNICYLYPPAGPGVMSMASASTVYAVTAADATNFYVGNATSYPNSGNINATTWYWEAIL